MLNVRRVAAVVVVACALIVGLSAGPAHADTCVPIQTPTAGYEMRSTYTVNAGTVPVTVVGFAPAMRVVFIGWTYVGYVAIGWIPSAQVAGAIYYPQALVIVPLSRIGGAFYC